ncbi:hypothetical protein ACQKFE_20230 [Stutzerimonas stutzeri]|uniref:hypothetical protein n=1 Tax=Stutzerimonas stutzeri TaxID=316 RepID=UPI003CFD6FA4
MNLFTHIANLITSVVRPETAAFTTVIYPSQGKAVVVHDGLGIRQERRWYQVDSLEDEDTITSFDSIVQEHTSWADPVGQVHAENTFSAFSSTYFEPMGTSWLNPANGMPMLDSCFDVMGNAFGTDTMTDSLSFDHGMSSFGDSFSSFGFD